MKQSVEWLRGVMAEERRGIPVILSGGAMYNDFLREAIEKALLQAGIRNHVITAVKIAEIIEEKEDVRVDELPRFCMLARGMQPRQRMDIARDVVGGLVEYVYEKEKKKPA